MPMKVTIKIVGMLIALLFSFACQAKTKTQIDSTMIVRISEIEVYPEHLQEYLEFAHNDLVDMKQMATECLPLIFNKAK